MDRWKLLRRLACILAIAAFFAAGLVALVIGKPVRESQTVEYIGHLWISEAGSRWRLRRVRSRDPLREIEAGIRDLDNYQPLITIF